MVGAASEQSARDERGRQHPGRPGDAPGCEWPDRGGPWRASSGPDRMVVLMVVPLKEGLAETAGVLDGAKAIRESGTIFKGAELTF